MGVFFGVRPPRIIIPVVPTGDDFSEGIGNWQAFNFKDELDADASWYNSDSLGL